MTRHLVPLLSAGALVVGGVAAVDRIGRWSPGEGVVWLVAVAPAGAALRNLPAAPDVRVMGVAAGGRLVQLHVRSLRDTAGWRPEGRWLLHVPQPAPGWLDCG
jgi:hypothetical protein